MCVVCEVCGNDIPQMARYCPHCRSKVIKSKAAVKIFQHRVLNLEEGRPVVEVALNRMQQGIADSIRQGFVVVTLIHGYGSSGRGGAIRKECRKLLDYMCTQGSISGYVLGEEFNRHHPITRQWLRRFPQLANNSHLNRGNRGVTLVFL